MQPWMKRAVLIAAGGFLLGGPVTGGTAQERYARQDGAKAVARAQAAPATAIPNVELVTHENRLVRFYDDLVRGRTVVMNFMYTTCDAYCPLTTANLARVQTALGARSGRDVFLYSITLDPEHDTPAVLADFRANAKAAAGWTFLTGTRENIEQLRRRLGVYDLDPAIDADKTKHSGILVYGNAATDRWAAMPSLADPAFIAGRILHVAGREASGSEHLTAEAQRRNGLGTIDAKGLTE